MSKSLLGKSAVVTGGSRGIGAAVALELARRGASVLVTYVSSAAAAEKVAADIQHQGCDVKGYAIQADCAKAMESAVKIVDEANKVFPEGIDIIVNNAADGSDIDLATLNTENFDRLFHTNVLFPMLLIQQARPHLRRKARIVNISSTAARRGIPSAITYGASKAALESITRSMAKELGRELECTVNAVNPGPVNTDMWSDTDGADAMTQRIMSETAAGSRIGETNDITPIVAFLCEEQSRWISGSVTCANGGWCIALYMANVINEMAAESRVRGTMPHTDLGPLRHHYYIHPEDLGFAKSHYGPVLRIAKTSCKFHRVYGARKMSALLKGRARLVCVECHGRKIKCDLEQSLDNTCAHCRRHSLTCIRRQGVRVRRRSQASDGRRRDLSDTSSPDMRLQPDSSYTFPTEAVTDTLKGSDDNSAYIAEHSVLQDAAYDHLPDLAATAPPPKETTSGITAGIRHEILKATDAQKLPKPALRQALFDAFFTNLSFTFPILDRSDVEQPGSSVLLQQAVCLAGSLMRHPSLPDSFPRSQAIYEKIKILICVNFEPNMLVVLKVLCLLTLWSPIPSHIVSLDGPWHATGTSLRLAVQMGMHRDSSYRSKADRKCRRRLWWLLYASNCVQGLIYGRLPVLKRNDFDVPPLTEDDFDDVNMEAKNFIADTALACIMGELAFKISRDMSSEQEGAHIAELLSGWITQLNPDLRLYDDNGRRTAYRFPISELHIQFFGTVILSQALSCGFAKQWPCSTACLIAATCIASLYEEVLCREQVALLTTMHAFWCLTAAIPLLYCQPDTASMEAQRKESLGILCSVVEQLQPRFGTARTVARKIKLLQCQRHNILSQPAADGDAGQTQAQGNNVTLHQVEAQKLNALFPQLKAWSVCRDAVRHNPILDGVAQTHAQHEAQGVELAMQWMSEGSLSAFDALGAASFIDTFFDDNYLNDEMAFDIGDAV